MKTILISAASFFFIFGATSARETVSIPASAIHQARATVNVRTSQLISVDRERGVLCGTTYVTTKYGDGTTTTRKSADCEE